MVKLLKVFAIACSFLAIACGGDMKVPNSLLEAVISHNMTVYAASVERADIYEEILYYSSKTKKFYFVEMFTYNKDRGESGSKCYIFDDGSGKLVPLSGVKIFGNRLFIDGEYATTLKHWSTMPVHPAH